MNIRISLGTRSILFGVHNPLLHGFFVKKTWSIVYGNQPSLLETIAIGFHDIGYLGSPEFDGAIGQTHPERSAEMVGRWIPCPTLHSLIRHHSRTYAALDKAPVSALALPDKFSLVLYPTWLYLALATATGELAEYKRTMGQAHLTDKEWHQRLCEKNLAWCLTNASPAMRKRIERWVNRHVASAQLT